MKLLLLLITLGFSLFKVSAQDFSQKAHEFLNSLGPELRQQAVFDLQDDERLNMNYVPTSRKGPSFNDFTDEQSTKALALLKACLSEQGMEKATDIIALETILRIKENANHRDPKDYHLCIFGDPTPDGLWGWRFEGHHLSLNFTNGKGVLASATPSFWGSNPAIVDIDRDRGKQVLKKETELGFQLINSMDQQQLLQARFSETAPREIITGNQTHVQALEPKGISYSNLNPAQQEILMKLLEVYIKNYQWGFAESFKKRIEQSGIDNLSFAWAGGLKPGQGHYYRIQGPMLLIEYDNTQNGANHVHTVVRDLENDFGEDILRQHYSSQH